MVIARSSLIESQNHLIDAVDRAYISEEIRLDVNALAERAIEEVTGMMEYLRSPEAVRNARRARERRIASRPERVANREPRTPDPEARTVNPKRDPEAEHEQRRENEEG